MKEIDTSVGCRCRLSMQIEICRLEKLQFKQTREKVSKAVNFAIVDAYWNIGRMIVEEEQSGEERANYGDYIIGYLSKKLTKDFGKGF